MAETETGSDLLEQAFALIAERGWRRFGRGELARRAGVPLKRVYQEFPTRAAVLGALGRRLDEAMLEVEPADLEGMSPRERVFELVMRRLDAMAPFKAGLRALGEAGADGDLLAAGCRNLGRTTGWLLEAAEPRLGALRRAAAGPALAMVYTGTVEVWLGDDTPDQAATLAELDRRLGQAERLARWTDWMDREREPREEDDEREADGGEAVMAAAS